MVKEKPKPLAFMKKTISTYINRRKNYTVDEWNEINGEFLFQNVKRTMLMLPALFLIEVGNLIFLLVSDEVKERSGVFIAGYLLLMAVSLAYFILFGVYQTGKRKFVAFLNVTCWIFIMIGALLITYGGSFDGEGIMTAVMFMLSAGVIPVMTFGSVAAFLGVFLSFNILFILMNGSPVKMILELLLFATMAFVISSVQYLFTFGFLSEYMLLNNKNKKLVEISERDPLTGLLNRRGFSNIMQERGKSGGRYAVLMIDIDNFKSYNDRYYHDAGDLCLQKVASALARSVFRRDDLVVRHGGEEFLIYLYDIGKDEVMPVAERIQNEIALMRIDLGDENNYVTVSIGVAFSPENRKAGLGEVIAEADKELYNAKKHGKDCISFGGRIIRTSPIRISQTVSDEVMKSLRVRPQHSGRKNLLVVEGEEGVFPGGLLEPEYAVVTAAGADEAERILTGRNSFISAVIIGAGLPEDERRAFLGRARGHEPLKNIPIIVAGEGEEAEKDALMLGAWDFVSIPSDASVIKFRLRNVIDRSQLPAFNQLKYLAEYDSLTGIFNKNRFFEETRTLISIGNSDNYAMIRFDINRFTLINSFFGVEEGDRVLKYLAHAVSDYGKFLYEYSFGRIEGDCFAVCLPYEGDDSVREFVDYVRDELKKYPLDFDIVPVFGVYVITNRSMQISLMLDQATMAAKGIKDNYLSGYAYYTEEMGRRITVEQELSRDMNEALEGRQFVVHFLPQYRLDTEEASGAEALVRWAHPEKGLIYPGEFIPLFERNGFIVKLDYYVWELVCQKLRQWMIEGFNPKPVSVNVSRVNLYSADFVDTLSELTEKYGVPNRMLNLEITESVYTKNPEIMLEVIKKLRSRGFVVMMDDFGNGYSSLNMLKDIEVDALKIDMRFLSGTQNVARGRSIISSVVGMAKRIHLATIAEGVEKKEQVAFLASVGCDFAQGYYYSKPLPCDEYEKRIIACPPGPGRSVEDMDDGVV